jgi:zinc protease
VAAYEDVTPGKPLMAARPAPGKIARTESIEELGVTVWTLSNGARVVVKPTEFQNDEIVLSGFSPGGHSLVRDADWVTGRFAAQVVADGGAGEHSAVALDKLLSGVLVRARPWINELEEGIDGSASPADLETMLQLVHLRMTSPRKDTDAFAAWKAGELEEVRHRDLDPQRAFFEQLQVVGSGGHKRYAPMTPELIEKVDLDRALAIYGERFGDAGDFVFVFVGNVEPATLAPLVETYLASLPSKGRKEKWRDVGVRPPRGKKSVELAKGREPKSSVFLQFHGDANWSWEQEDDLEMLAEVLRIRLREVLREDLGGVYGVGSWGQLTRRPRQRYSYVVTFGCAPENVGKLREAVADVVADIKANGIGADYVAKVKELRRRAYETDVKENSFWVQQLASHYRHGTDPRDIAREATRADRVTSERVQKAAKRYIGKQVIAAVLNPEAAAAAAPAAPPAQEGARP